MNAYAHLGLSVFFISVIGSCMHFVFAWSRCSSLVGFIAATNESVWEHTKLMLWPIVAWWMCLCERSVKSAVLATYTSTALMFGIYAIISEAARYEALWLDISLFVFCVMCGQLAGIKSFQRNDDDTAAVYGLFAFMIACMSSFTLVWIPAVPYLFLDHPRQVYGPFCAL